MARMICRGAYHISRALLPAQHKQVFTNLKLLREGHLTYDSQANPTLSAAVQIAEDREFKLHPGFHLRGIMRAFYVYFTRRQLQGASTVEQQLVRVVRKRYEITFSRKLSEILLATALGAEFDKDTIMELYMEVCYFGWRGTGIRQICRRLETEPNSMTTSEACFVAALIKLPLPRNPSKQRLDRTAQRVEYIRNTLLIS